MSSGGTWMSSGEPPPPPQGLFAETRVRIWGTLFQAEEQNVQWLRVGKVFTGFKQWSEA